LLVALALAVDVQRQPHAFGELMTYAREAVSQELVGSNGPTLLNHALCSGATIITQILADFLQTPSSAFQRANLPRLFAAEADDGRGLHAVLQARQGGAMATYIDLLAEAVKTQWLQLEDVQLLVADVRDAARGQLYLALQNGETATVRNIVEVVSKLAHAGLLSREDVKELVAGRRDDGTPGLYMAAQNGHSETVSTFLDGVRQLAQAGLLTPADVKELAAARRADGRPWLYMAARNDHSGTIAVGIKGLHKLFVAGVLERADLKDLVLAEHQQQSAMQYALLIDKFEAATAIFNAVMELAESVMLDANDVSNLKPKDSEESKKLVETLRSTQLEELRSRVKHLGTACKLGILTQREQESLQRSMIQATIDNDDAIAMSGFVSQVLTDRRNEAIDNEMLSQLLGAPPVPSRSRWNPFGHPPALSIQPPSQRYSSSAWQTLLHACGDALNEGYLTKEQFEAYTNASLKGRA
jgi:hypothetical protein